MEYTVKKYGDVYFIRSEDGGLVRIENLHDGRWYVVDMVDEWYANSLEEALTTLFSEEEGSI